MTTMTALKSIAKHLLGYLFLAGFGLAAFVVTRDLCRAHASKTWPTTTGTIVSSSIEQKDTGRRGSAPVYFGRVTYRYEVDGATHTSSQVSYGDHGETGTDHDRDVVARYPAGRAVTVHYRPESPGTAVLVPGAGLSAWLLSIGFLVVFPGIPIFHAARWLVARWRTAQAR